MCVSINVKAMSGREWKIKLHVFFLAVVVQRFCVSQVAGGIGGGREEGREGGRVGEEEKKEGGREDGRERR